eukprot:CAMPEP_0174259172 /NCGR_PEP_ID=MMETSP0439-20130205/8042_1 /TAXON_ID=0 /ORGANISM="Stereomyxa ramosa, Strain Chinc5" /LENGTH=130 /DNA_ID=CAMNT_0015342967 /DNA_START=577 /DNA_END=965 /DNA_ORIENTATION=-
MVAFDGSSGSYQSLKRVAQFAASGVPLKEVYFLFVIDAKMFAVESSSLKKSDDKRTISGFDSHLRQRANSLLTPALQELQQYNVKCTKVVSEGLCARETICDEVVKKGIDLLVIGTRADNSIEKLLVGSV